ncbi:NAD-specific glutamate dehydrogenase [Halarchaeum acidiphilum MH1-52-1]|uniref:NAD-specific glutamate dehydrogenase n=1 Tax=Halarchaeum acidiphilum MH1-52-1 TaxID=1261545 RepID=U3AG64_9EURY|nr:NAD-specific glutamate dehydrogenase [Halarchaeum acidiphilum MH1-52-1]
MGRRLSAYEDNDDATWREAAYVVALDRVTDAHEARGF